MLMKSDVVALLVILALAGMFHGCRQQPQLQSELYVATDGSDENEGSHTKPFATLQRAADVIRERGPLQHDVRILVRGGVYLLDRAVVFTDTEANSQNYSITVTASPGSQPVFMGGRHINGWRKGEKNLWTTELPDVREGKWWFRKLVVNGRAVPRSRFPNKPGMLTINAVSKDVKKFSFEEHLPVFSPSAQNAELVVLHDWSIARGLISEVRSHSVGTKTAMGWIGHEWTTARVGRKAYLEHAREFVDVPGEWYLDRAHGILYYQAGDNEDPNLEEFIAPHAAELLVVKGSKGSCARNLNFVNVTFAFSSWQLPDIGYRGIQAAHYGTIYSVEPTFAMPLAVRLQFAENCSFIKCRFLHLGSSGLGMGAGCRDNRVLGCEFGDIGGNGIMIGWRPEAGDPPRMWFENDWKDAEEIPRRNIVSNCFVHDCGAENLGAVGIFEAFAQQSRISHNLLNNLPYTGISIGFRWDDTPSSERECIVEYNHIHNVMRSLADGGGIYTLGVQPGTVLKGNLIHDIRRSADAGGSPNNGIFLDQGSKGFVIEDNVIFDTAGQAVRISHDQKDWHVWKNNKFSRSDSSQVSVSDALQAGPEEEYRSLFSEK
jgi:hypothetical protein